jgi:hypothetical protein
MIHSFFFLWLLSFPATCCFFFLSVQVFSGVHPCFDFFIALCISINYKLIIKNCSSSASNFKVSAVQFCNRQSDDFEKTIHVPCTSAAAAKDKRFSKLKYIVLPFWNPHEGKVLHNQVCSMPYLEITFKGQEIPQCRFKSFSNPSQQINLLVSCNK